MTHQVAYPMDVMSTLAYDGLVERVDHHAEMYRTVLLHQPAYEPVPASCSCGMRIWWRCPVIVSVVEQLFGTDW